MGMALGELNAKNGMTGFRAEFFSIKRCGAI